MCHVFRLRFRYSIVDYDAFAMVFFLFFVAFSVTIFNQISFLMFWFSRCSSAPISIINKKNGKFCGK